MTAKRTAAAASDAASDAATNAEANASNAATDAESSTTFRSLARLGYAVNALLHALIGVIAITVALGTSTGEADQSGALGQLAANPGGIVLLWVITVGLFGLGLWQIVDGVRIKAAEKKKRWGKRISAFGKAVAYIAVGVTALTYALGGSKSSSGSSQGASASALSTPGGVFLLIAVGLLVGGIGVFFVVRGVLHRFTRDLQLPGGATGRAVVVLGVVGYVAKGLSLVVVGVLFVVAAATSDASKASGLDGALKAMVALPFGQIILVVVGIGLIAYGAYQGAVARWGKL